MGGNGRDHLHLRLLALFVTGLLLTGALMTIAVSPASGLTEGEKADLASMYSPVFHYANGESCYPVDVDYFLSQCSLFENGGSNLTLVTSTPTASSLGSFTDPTEDYFLDNQVGTNHDDNITSQYARDEKDLGYTVYAHVSQVNGTIILQYWVFYVFYQGLYSAHEGDWETVQITLTEDLEPLEVMLSQHNSGYRVAWQDMERPGDHMNVYVAQASHANYVRYWEGQIAYQKDVVNKDGKVIGEGSYDLVLLGDAGAGNHPSSEGWIDFAGRWGDWGKGTDDYIGQRGPLGPAYVNSGTSFGSVAWGSALPRQNMALVNAQVGLFYYNLLYLLIVLIPALFIVHNVYRKYRRNELHRPYLHLFDFKGDRIEKMVNILAIAGLAIGLISAFFPYYTAQVSADTTSFSTNGFEDIVSIDGLDGAQIYALDPELGKVQMSSIPIPFGMLIAASIVLFVMKLVGEDEKVVGKEYLSKGFSLVTPLIITIILVVFLPSLMPDLNPAEGEQATKAIISTVSHDPLGGQTMQNVDTFGTLELRWGIGIGGLLMIVAGASMAAAGVLMIMLGLKRNITDEGDGHSTSLAQGRSTSDATEVIEPSQLPTIGRGPP